MVLSAGSWHLAADPPDLLPSQPSAVLDEHHPSIAGFQWSGPACVGAHRLTMTLGLPHRGGQISVPWTTTYACPRGSTADPQVDLQADPLGAHSPQGDLTWAAPFVTRILEQHTATAGGVIRYQIQLTMMRGTAATRPCYPYRETLRNALTFVVVADELHTLTCVGLPPLTRYGTVWDMQVRVPATVVPGTQLAIGWECVIPGCANEASPRSDFVTVVP